MPGLQGPGSWQVDGPACGYPDGLSPVEVEDDLLSADPDKVNCAECLKEVGL